MSTINNEGAVADYGAPIGGAEYEVLTPSATEAITNAELNQLTARAIKIPRVWSAISKRVIQDATMTQEIAESCQYALPPREAGGKFIKGASVRFAEIVANNYGNCRILGRVTETGDKHVTGQGLFMDAETGVMWVLEVHRKIVNKQGRRYSEDMINMTKNAAVSIALRNAIERGVGKAKIEMLLAEVKKVINKDQKPVAERRAATIEFYKGKKIELSQILEVLKINAVEDIGEEELELLRDMAVAVKDGVVDSFQEMFPPAKDQAQALAERLAARDKEEPEPEAPKALEEPKPETRSDALATALSSVPEKKKK